MSKTLEERLASHADSFSGLLSLIPAKHYYNEETSNQWKGGKKKNKKLAKAKKAAKFDGEKSGSALEEQTRRQLAATSESNEAADDVEAGSDSDDDVVMAFDDSGNALDGEANLREEGSKETTSVPQEVPKQQQKTNASEKTKKKPQIVHHTGKDASESSTSADQPKKPSEGIQELRARLSSKIQELREKRKAPGSGAPGAPANREAILESRKKRQQAAKEKRAEKRKREADAEVEEELEDVIDGHVDPETATTNHSNLVFSQIQFANGQRTGADIATTKDRKAGKQRDIVGQLKHLQNKKAKIASLDEEKRKAIEQNAQWSRAILSAEGQKVRDDEKMLRKAVKSQQKKKDKSEKEWKERKERQDKALQHRLAKREENIQQHKELKGVKGKQRKKLLNNHKKRAGFEGKNKKPRKR